MVPVDEVEYESLELSCQDKEHNSLPDPDLEIRGDQSSRLLDMGGGGGGGIFQSFGPHFGPKIRRDPSPGSATAVI